MAYHPAISMAFIIDIVSIYSKKVYKESMFLEEGERRRYTLLIVKEIKERSTIEVGPLHTLFCWLTTALCLEQSIAVCMFSIIWHHGSNLYAATVVLFFLQAAPFFSKSNQRCNANALLTLQC